MTPHDAAIFDLDGLLIDSEPFWQRAEVDVLGDMGLPITIDDARRTMGMRIDEVVRLWYRRQPWDETRAGGRDSCSAVAERIVDRVIELVRDLGEPREGALEAIDGASARGLRIGLASSSSMRLIHAALQVLGIAERFEVVESAEHEPLGKPHPAVYLNAARSLGIEPRRCIAIEDSLNGMIAAKAASMTCILVPDSTIVDDPRTSLADVVLPTLAALDDAAWARI